MRRRPLPATAQMSTTPAPSFLFETTLNVDFSRPTSVSVATLHPNLEFEETQDPIELTSICRARQRNVIRATLDAIQNGQISEELMVWPEFSIPREQFAEVDAAIRETRPNNSILIAGLEHVTVPVARTILDSSEMPGVPGREAWREDQFLNLCLIWVKESDGNSKLFVQPKLSRSAPEQAAQVMAVGAHVHLFVCSGITFCILLCYDAIGELSPGVRIVDKVLTEIGALTSKQPSRTVPLDLVIVPQRNKSPESDDFLTFPERVVTATVNGVASERAAVLFVNTAFPGHGRSLKGLGRSAIYYSRTSWLPVEAKGPVLPTYAVEDVSNHPDLVRARFREDGANICTFRLLVPRATNRAAATGARYPLEDARLAMIADDRIETLEAKFPYKKVISDWAINVDVSTELLPCECDELKRTLQQLYDSVCLAIRAATERRISHIVNTLFVGSPTSTPHNPDSWQRDYRLWYADPVHGKALLNLFCSLSVLGIPFPSRMAIPNLVVRAVSASQQSKRADSCNFLQAIQAFGRELGAKFFANSSGKPIQQLNDDGIAQRRLVAVSIEIVAVKNVAMARPHFMGFIDLKQLRIFFGSVWKGSEGI
jgi:hypothetical protein